MKATKVVIAIIFLSAWSAAASAQAPPTAPNPLHRQYREGETLVYRMTGVNENWHYTLRAEGIVKKNDAGHFVEEFRWTDMASDCNPIALSPSMADFRQRLSLDPGVMPALPDLSKVDPKIIGPITDLMTFYVDLWLPAMMGSVKKPGDHFYFKTGRTNSWADGTRVLTGSDAIDFDFTLKSIDTAAGTALLEVKHVPPQDPKITLPAAWMQPHVGDGANNWVEVVKQQDGKFEAGVGEETFIVDLTVSLADGKILSGTMDNIVKTTHRTCDDPALTQCTPPQPHQIERKIEIALEPARP
jgi:hypothetical protein